ncbi:MAG: efflux RND transporter periplasmic adaptor subunit [Clostridiales bacterium]|nr:efflux RND transporter periplasmic adaptor subunit [Clostridiales bacterium]MDY5515408.1 efflux RND transporter periplasmic adaptor subunit [Candidatus Ventricola sp.]
MKTKLLSFAALLLVLTLGAACALGATANAVIVAPETAKITAPFSGTLLAFDLTAGDEVAAGDTLFAMDTVPVYATQSGTVSAVFAKAGDDASGVIAHYGSLAVIEPTHALYVAADNSQAYDDDENRYLHAGETLYLKCGNEKGTGIVTSVSGNAYNVEILTGSFDVGDTVRCYRESGTPSDSETGRGRVTRYADISVAAEGRIAAVHVKAGDTVSVGDLLFEVIDGQSAKDVPLTLTAPVSGAVTSLSTVSGAQVYRGQLLCEIADLTKLELSAEVDELDFSAISVGTTLSFTLDAYAGETFSGTVTEIRPVGITRQNATYYDVRITLPAGKTLLPGMNATVMIP